MAPRTRLLRALAAALSGLLVSGCFEEPPLPESGIEVFGDAFATGFTPNAFQYSLLTSLSIDTTKAHSGSASIKLTVPASASTPGFSGGAVLAAQPQDLSSTNALVFWTLASRAATFDSIGFGLNFSPYPSTYQVLLANLPLTTTWTRHYIPIPDSSKLTAERGMLWWADADPIAYTAWLDDVKYDRLDAATMALAPAIGTATLNLAVGASGQVGGLSLQYTDFDGSRRSVDSTAQGSGPAAAYFAFASSNPAVATVDATGKITAVGAGQASVTARLGGIQAAGSVTVNVGTGPPSAPVTAAPTPPARNAADVVSLYNSSATYTDVPVDTWGTGWSNGGAGPNLTAFTIQGTGSVVKKYTAMQYVGVEFLSPGPHVNAGAMTTMHVDLWTPNATQFSVKLVGFSGNTAGAEFQVNFTSGTIVQGSWVALEIPLSSFTGVDLTSIGQLLWVDNTPNASDNGTFFIDNVYFHK